MHEKSSLVRVMDKRDFLFRFLDKSTRYQLLFDHEAFYSTTDQITADKITRDLLRFFPRNARICDGTACVGGNLYSFAQAFEHVMGIEMDAVRYRYMVHNMKVLGMTHVQSVCADVLAWAPSGRTDLLFLDPPWGGPDYKTRDRVVLYLSGKPLWEACLELAATQCTRYIALKVPKNFDQDGFDRETADRLELKHKNTQLRKMHLLLYRVMEPRPSTQSAPQTE